MTGYYTTRTAVAVARFQRSIGVTPNRQVGRGTWAALHSYGTSPLVKRGSSSDRVRSLQRALTAALDRPVAASGIFTAGTTNAVRRYQANVGIHGQRHRRPHHLARPQVRPTLTPADLSDFAPEEVWF